MRLLSLRIRIAALGLFLAGGGLVSPAFAHDGADLLPLLAGFADVSLSPSVSGVSAAAVPVYSSLPGANATLYLDFAGDTTASWGSYSPGTTPAYSIDADTDHFSQDELNNIYEIWQRVTEEFSPFNINVTTAAAPAVLNDGQSFRVVIGGDGKNGAANYWAGAKAGGIGYVGSFTDGDPNTAYVFSGNLANGTPKYTAMAIAHETGHGFGLQHQSAWNNGVKTEYNPGTADRAPIMGVSYAATRGVWYNGTTFAPSIYQDDLSVITGAANGFGYRADDHGNSVAAATQLTQVGNELFGSGVIETMLDQDFFQFTIGQLSDANFTVTGAPFGAMLDPSLALYGLDGSLIQMVATSSLSEMLSATLSPGTYDLAVLSAGNYGDIGQYTLSGTVIAVPEPVALAGLGIFGLLLCAARRRRDIIAFDR